MKLNRVVVTGYGLTSPIGNTPEEFWNSLKEGKILLFIMRLKSKTFHLINTLSRKIPIVLTIILCMPYMQLKKR